MTTQSAGGVPAGLPRSTTGYALGSDDGEAIWFNTGLGLLKATAAQTDGRFAILELRLPRDFASPIHVHHGEDEFFLVLDGEVRIRHGDDVFEGSAGSLSYSPRGTGHGFRVDSDEARLLLFFGPAGVEEFFREVGTEPRWLGLPPSDEPVPDRETLVEIMKRHNQSVLGPPLPPKDASTA